MVKKYDEDYTNECIKDLKKWRKLLADKDNIDCIIDLIKDYKKIKVLK